MQTPPPLRRVVAWPPGHPAPAPNHAHARGGAGEEVCAHRRRGRRSTPAHGRASCRSGAGGGAGGPTGGVGQGHPRPAAPCRPDRPGPPDGAAAEWLPPPNHSLADGWLVKTPPPPAGPRPPHAGPRHRGIQDTQAGGGGVAGGGVGEGVCSLAAAGVWGRGTVTARGFRAAQESGLCSRSPVGLAIPRGLARGSSRPPHHGAWGRRNGRSWGGRRVDPSVSRFPRPEADLSRPRGTTTRTATPGCQSSSPGSRSFRERHGGRASAAGCKGGLHPTEPHPRALGRRVRKIPPLRGGRRASLWASTNRAKRGRTRRGAALHPSGGRRLRSGGPRGQPGPIRPPHVEARHHTPAGAYALWIAGRPRRCEQRAVVRSSLWNPPHRSGWW